MQNAKDSFYMALRTRLAAINPDRTILIRGTVRPGILIEEAEAPFAQHPLDVFILRWLNVDADTALPTTVSQECELAYQTAGTQTFGGLDRGRILSKMDAELRSMVAPLRTMKSNFSSNPPEELSTQVFWNEPIFGTAVTQRERIGRTVKVRVYSYMEEGE